MGGDEIGKEALKTRRAKPEPILGRRTAREHIFLSYPQDVTDKARRLRQDLLNAGFVVWWGEDVLPGEDPQLQAAQAMRDARAVVLCLSAGTADGQASNLFAEARDAIDLYRQQSPGQIFLIPVRFANVEIPPFEIDATHRLETLKAVDLFPEERRRPGLERLIAALRKARGETEPEPTPEPEESEEDRRVIRPRPRDHRHSEELTRLYEDKKSRAIAGKDVREVVEAIRRKKAERHRGHDLEPGERLLGGRFELLETLGKGGFGRVWKAWDEDASTCVAIKVLFSHLLDERSKVERFFRGARWMAKLGHPYIVRVLEAPLVDEDDGWHFFVMEWIDGPDLERAILDGLPADTDKPRIIRQIGEALEYAHSQGLIHRDVKPSNILLDGHLAPKLTDFDLVRADDTATPYTQTHAMMGTVHFAAPELLHSPRDAGPSCDVYSLASTAVFVLHGERLPHGYYKNPPKVIAGLDIPQALKEVLTRATDDDPDGRYQRAGEFVEAFIGAMEIPPPLNASPSPIRSPAWASDAGRDEFGPWASFKVGAVEQRARWIEPGSFLMGSPEEGRYDREGPQHQVELTEGFWLAETLCTQELWQEAMGENPSIDKGRSHPVENVSWHDCQEFLEALNERVPGLEAELPTEAQWEYACRAGMREPRYSPKLDDIAWADSFGGAQPVGEKAPNPWGLYDMLGNLWEWCSDWYAAYSAASAVDPTGPTKGTLRILRGGSWDSHASHVRVAARYWRTPGGHYSDLGLRLALGQSLGAEVRGAESGGAADRPRPGGSSARDEPASPGRRPVEISEISDPEEQLFRWIDTSHDGRVELWRDIPAGEFWMGSPDGQGESWEHPRHHVKVTSGFQLCAGPVTNAQYAVFKPKGADMSKPNHPVVKVTWRDAMAFCEWLSDHFKWARGARLPTEEEWEYAARAGTETRYWSGDEESDLDRVGWYTENSGRRLHAVGEKPANAWGLYDVHGNVWEWTLTEWAAGTYGKRGTDFAIDPSDAGAADLAAARGGGRVVRGGSWIYSAVRARSAFRFFRLPGDGSWYRGFRVLLPPSPRAGH